MAEHSPVPWRVSDAGPGYFFEIVDADGVMILEPGVHPEAGRSVANLVIATRAVNHHDALVAVVEALAADLTAACDLASPAREEVWRRDIAEARRVLDAVRDGGGSTSCDV